MILTIIILNADNLCAQWSGTNPITTNDNVGIKVNNNDASLNVTGAGDSATVLITQGSISWQGYYGPFRVRQADFIPIGSPNPQTYTPLFIGGPGGYVGVGTDFPTQKFQVVNGNMQCNTGDIISYNGSIKTQNSSGTTNFKVDGNGFLIARQIDVHLDPIPDYVFHAAFDQDSADFYDSTGVYKPVTLQQVDTFVQANRHLPGIKSAADYKQAGSINIGELQLQLLQKVEELTLYNIQLMKELQELKKKQTELEQKSISTKQ